MNCKIAVKLDCQVTIKTFTLPRSARTSIRRIRFRQLPRPCRTLSSIARSNGTKRKYWKMQNVLGDGVTAPAMSVCIQSFTCRSKPSLLCGTKPRTKNGRCHTVRHSYTTLSYRFMHSHAHELCIQKALLKICNMFSISITHSHAQYSTEKC